MLRTKVGEDIKDISSTFHQKRAVFVLTFFHRSSRINGQNDISQVSRLKNNDRVKTSDSN
jgi:hypothetical protein